MEILAYIGISLLLLFELVVATYVNAYLCKRLDNSVVTKIPLNWIILLCFVAFQVSIFTMTMGLYKLV